MKLKLKYVIGGALVSLATLAASGAANAGVVINEPDGVEFGMGVVAPVGALPAGVNANAVLINEMGACTNAADFVACKGSMIGGDIGGDTVFVRNNPAGGFFLDWVSGSNDMMNPPADLNESGFVCIASGSCTFVGTLPPGTGTGPGLSISTVSDFSVPEPATLALFASGLIGLGLIRRRRKAKAAKA